MNSLKTVLTAGFFFIAALFLDSPVGYTLFIRHPFSLLIGGLVIFATYFALVIKIKTTYPAGLLNRKKDQKVASA